MYDGNIFLLRGSFLELHKVVVMVPEKRPSQKFTWCFVVLRYMTRDKKHPCSISFPKIAVEWVHWCDS